MEQSSISRWTSIILILTVALTAALFLAGCNRGGSAGVYARSAEEKALSVKGLTFSASLSYTRVVAGGASSQEEFTMCTDLPMSKRKMGSVDGVGFSVRYDFNSERFSGMIGNDQLSEIVEKFTMTEVMVTIEVSNGIKHTEMVGSGIINDFQHEIFTINSQMPLKK